MLLSNAPRPALALLGLAALGCSDEAVCVSRPPSVVASRFASAEQAIVGGNPDADYLALSGAELENIGAILLVDPGGDDRVICTGVVIAEHWIATAKHCTNVGQLRFRDGGGALFDVESEHTHPDLDVALLRLASECGAPSGSPLPWLRDVDAVRLGQRTLLAGHGTTEDSLPGGLRFVVESVVEQTPLSITVRGSGGTGACSGDSGGPLIGRGPDGAVSVLGTLSRGSADCQGIDVYVRLGAASDWLDSMLGAAAPPALACGALDESGRCFDGDAVWCDEGELVREACAPGVCGWVSEAGGYRCAAASDCRGDDWGECDESTLRVCVAGEASERACAGACGFDGTGAAACY